MENIVNEHRKISIKRNQQYKKPKSTEINDVKPKRKNRDSEVL